MASMDGQLPNSTKIRKNQSEIFDMLAKFWKDFPWLLNLYLQRKFIHPLSCPETIDRYITSGPWSPQRLRTLTYFRCCQSHLGKQDKTRGRTVGINSTPPRGGSC